MVMATVLGFIFAVLEIKNHMKARLKRLTRLKRNACKRTQTLYTPAGVCARPLSWQPHHY
jgi:hypothetical protein